MGREGQRQLVGADVEIPQVLPAPRRSPRNKHSHNENPIGAATAEISRSAASDGTPLRLQLLQQHPPPLRRRENNPMFLIFSFNFFFLAYHIVPSKDRRR